MDFIQGSPYHPEAVEHASSELETDYITPVDWSHYLFTYYTPTYLHPLYTTTSTLRAYLLPLFARLTANPDLASIALLLVILFVSLKILDMLRRAVMFWVSLVTRALFWGALVLGGLYVWNRGVEGAVEDAQYWAERWMGEFRFYREQAEAARVLGGQMGGAVKRRGREG